MTDSVSDLINEIIDGEGVKYYKNLKVLHIIRFYIKFKKINKKYDVKKLRKN